MRSAQDLRTFTAHFHMGLGHGPSPKPIWKWAVKLRRPCADRTLSEVDWMLRLSTQRRPRRRLHFSFSTSCLASAGVLARTAARVVILILTWHRTWRSSWGGRVSEVCRFGSNNSGGILGQSTDLVLQCRLHQSSAPQIPCLWPLCGAHGLGLCCCGGHTRRYQAQASAGLRSST